MGGSTTAQRTLTLVHYDADGGAASILPPGDTLSLSKLESRHLLVLQSTEHPDMHFVDVNHPGDAQPAELRTVIIASPPAKISCGECPEDSTAVELRYGTLYGYTNVGDKRTGDKSSEKSIAFHDARASNQRDAIFRGTTSNRQGLWTVNGHDCRIQITFETENDMQALDAASSDKPGVADARLTVYSICQHL